MNLLFQKSHPNYNDLRWLASALNLKDKDRFLVRHIYVLDGNVYACDCYRMHVILDGASRLSLETGVYSVFKNTKSEIQLRKLMDNEVEDRPPPFLAIIPIIKEGSTLHYPTDIIKKYSIISLQAGMDELQYHVQACRTIYYQDYGATTVLDYQHIKDATAIYNGKCNMYLCKEIDHRATILLNGYYLALITPKKLHVDLTMAAKSAQQQSEEIDDGGK